MADALDSDFLQHLHLLFLQRTGRSNNDRLTSVDTQGVEVLHRGNGEAVVVGIADALELNLLPALQRLLNKNLGSKGEGTLSQFFESFLVRTDT